MSSESEARILGLADVSPRIGTLTRKGRRTLLITIDLLIVIASVLCSLYIWSYRSKQPFNIDFIRSNVEWFVFMAAAWLVAAAFNDLFRPNLASHFRQVTMRLFGAQAIPIGLYLLIYFLSRPQSLPRGIVISYAAIATPLLFFWRWLFSITFSGPRFRQRTLIVGAGWAGSTAVALLRMYLPYEIDLIGLVDDDPQKQGSQISDVTVIGSGDSLIDLVKNNNIDLIVIAITNSMRPELFRNILTCQEAGIGVVDLSVLYEQTLERTPIYHLSQQWFFNFEPPDMFTVIIKRCIDLGFSLFTLCFFVLLLPFLALAIYLDCPGPIFYRQQRVGKNGKLFWVYKLRSMVPNAEARGAQWAQKNDSRITRVGRFLRKTRIDELPQVWNILKGDMSLIGPRPERPEFVAKLQEQIPYYRSRLSVKPGLTGWAQVRYRYGNTVEDASIKLEYDLYYIKRQSLALDLSIAFRTISVILSMGGT